MVNYMKMNLKVEFIINEKDNLNFISAAIGACSSIYHSMLLKQYQVKTSFFLN